ncbi:MAG: T9SS type A sorting domain-containing protein [Cyclobacteriaceae bacterium]
MKQPPPISLLLVLMLSATVSAQDVISSSGNHHENSSAMISYTVGETVILTGTSSENILTQGFHQTKLTVTGIELPLGLDIRVYPNPTSDRIIVEFNDDIEAQLSLYDISGRLVEHRPIAKHQRRVEFDLSNESAGNYLLNIKDASNNLNTYRIVKTNQP